MNCRRVESLLSNHLEGRLPHRTESALARHLSECRSCRRLREAIVAAENELRCPVDPWPPSGIEARAVRLWQAEAARSHRRARSGPLLPATAAVAPPSYAGHRVSLQRCVLTTLLLLAILILEVPAAGGRDAGTTLRATGTALIPRQSGQPTRLRGMTARFGDTADGFSQAWEIQ
jgi:predicted anti-sigma-YlaC factor YlaD